MAINFPASPTLNQVYSANTKSWTWTGTAWKSTSSSGTIVTTNKLLATATGGQTLFTTPRYVQGANQVSVFINGVKQYDTEYTETSNTSITLSNSATANDKILVEVNGYLGNPIVTGAPTIVDDVSGGTTRYPLMAQVTSGSLTLVNTASTDFTFNPSTNVLFVPNLQFNDGTTISTSFAAAGSYANSAYAQANGASIYANGAFIQANTPSNIANSAFIQANSDFNTANNNAPATITDDTTNNLTLYPLLSLSSSGNLSKANTSTTKLSFNPSTGTLTANAFSGVFPTGTLMLFQQTAAPTGWTKQATHNNKALRVVTGSASSGGTTAFTSVFASRTPAGTVSGTNASGAVSAYTLVSPTDIPSHGHQQTVSQTTATTAGPNTRGTNTNASNAGSTQSTQATGSGGGHSHGFTQPTWSGSFTGTALDFAVQYVDLIIAAKD